MATSVQQLHDKREEELIGSVDVATRCKRVGFSQMHVPRVLRRALTRLERSAAHAT